MPSPSATSPPPSPHDLVLFVSCVKDKPVTRLSLRPGPRQLIGAERGEARQLTFDEAAVVALTRAEVEAFGAVYERTVKEGHLRRRTREEWEAAKAAQKARAREEQAKITAAEEAAQKAAGAAQNRTAEPSRGDVS